MDFVVFLGLPGTGKGTQCALLKERDGAAYISPGEVIRAKLASGDDDVKELADIVNNGQLLSDDFIMKLVENNIKTVMRDKQDQNDGLLIFDGIPRTVMQAKMLDDLLVKNFNKKVDLVVCLDVKKRVILKRLQSRVMCSVCGTPSSLLKSKNFLCNCGSTTFVRRKDDNESVIRRRLINDKKNMFSIYKYYLNNESKCCKLDGNSNQKSVYKKLRNVLFSNIV